MSTISIVDNTYTKVKDLLFGFKYSIDLKIIICSMCKTTIYSKDSISRHVDNYHTILTKVDLNSLIRLLEPLEVVDSKDIEPIPNYTYNFKDLTTILKGFICLECDNYSSTSYKKLRTHLNNTHNIKALGKIKDSLIPYYRAEYPLQSLYRGISKRYYAIKQIDTTLLGTNSTSLLGTNSTSLLGTNSISLLGTNSTPLLGTNSTSLVAIDSRDSRNSSNLFSNYKLKEKEIDNNSLIYNIATIGLGTKNLKSFLTNSRWNEFLINKDIKAYIKLIERPTISKINNPLGYLYTTTKDLLYRSEGLIYKLNRRYK